MDKPFDISEWQPTEDVTSTEDVASTEDLTSLSIELSQRTLEIIERPYNPATWLRRASTLAQLHYPELAVGDAYKAERLCSMHLSRLDAGGGWRLGHGMGFWMQAEQVPTYDMNDGEQKLRELLFRHQEAAQHVLNEFTWPDLFDESRYVGSIRFRSYPWMNAAHRARNDNLLKTINREFDSNSALAVSGQRYCIVRRHAFQKHVNGQDTSELLGVFAKHNIHKGDKILIDKARAWGMNGSRHGADYVTLDGRTVDMRWVRDRMGGQAGLVRTLLTCRLLSCSIDDRVKHPLDHPLIARLTPLYRKHVKYRYGLEEHVAIPQEVLQRFGIDIFANLNYDTWILFTIRARVRNNSAGSSIGSSLNPLFSLFNHSCEPNVDWKFNGSQTIEMTAERHIKKGEQLLVTYAGYDDSVDKRRRALQTWLDGPCECPRCLREDEEQQRVREREGTEVVETPLWDVGERPVFPEDSLKARSS